MALYLGRGGGGETSAGAAPAAPPLSSVEDKDGGGATNVRGLVESCAHNDDIGPLIKLVFDAQALGDSAPTIAGDPWVAGGTPPASS
jgi:hypothetical protein